MNAKVLFWLGAALIGAALFSIRLLSESFRVGTTTNDHPYLLFTALLVGANFILLLFIPLLKRIERPKSINTWLWAGLIIGLSYRALFIGSVPIYEDDWNRYLWDGTVVANGQNPYPYSPEQILGDMNDPKLNQLRVLSNQHPDRVRRINNRQLATIYPPIAMSVFGLAALIKPMDLDVLRGAFLIVEAITLFLMIKALTLYGRSPLWAALYALNPLVIFSGFNVAHMDILLPPFILAALIFIRKKPILAGLALTGAAGIKLWPLLLAPVLFRRWLKAPAIYISAAIMILVLSLILFWPLLSVSSDVSGLKAYSGQWKRSSFLFPLIENFVGVFVDTPGAIARKLVGGLLIALSLYLGFLSKNRSDDTLTKHLLILILALLLLSPTGFPWYVTWALILLPFVPSYGLAILAALVPLYYVRFALGEQNIYHVYNNWLVPLQFGLPILALGFELWRGRVQERLNG